MGLVYSVLEASVQSKAFRFTSLRLRAIKCLLLNNPEGATTTLILVVIRGLIYSSGLFKLLA